MRLSLLQPLIISAVIALCPAISNAQSQGDLGDIFRKSCVSAWMENTEKVTDKVSYKNFGEKYCNCMSTKPIETDAEMKKSAQLCMSQTLLHETMENLGEDPGLSNLTETKIEEACVEEWNFVYMGLTGDTKEQVSDYCKCAAPKLNDMNKDRDNMTDQDWNDKINSIAEDCANKVEARKSTSDVNKSSSDTNKPSSDVNGSTSDTKR